MVAIHVNSTGGMDPLLERLARIIRALRPLQVAYKTAGSVEALSPDLLALAQECQALVDEDAPGPMPALRHLVEDHQDDAPDIERHITLYNDGCPVIAAALPVKFGDEELGSLEEVVASQRQLLDGMTQPQLQPQVEECRQATLQVGLDMAQVNSDGLPSLFWPASAPTRFIFRLAFLVWMWIKSFAAHQDRDLLTWLRLDFSGRSHSILRPSLLAHEQHDRSFVLSERQGERQNGTIQSWGTNLFLRSDRLSRILNSVDQTRVSVATLLERLSAAQLVTVSADVINSIKDRQCILPEATVEALRSNGLSLFVSSRHQDHTR
ncbi:unnamed protein product [Sympodiomycopsis kandeliae]